MTTDTLENTRLTLTMQQVFESMKQETPSLSMEHNGSIRMGTALETILLETMLTSVPKNLGLLILTP
jgi:hypothetical protein